MATTPSNASSGLPGKPLIVDPGYLAGGARRVSLAALVGISSLAGCPLEDPQAGQSWR